MRVTITDFSLHRIDVTTVADNKKQYKTGGGSIRAYAQDNEKSVSILIETAMPCMVETTTIEEMKVFITDTILKLVK